jgi:hypothetical protein
LAIVLPAASSTVAVTVRLPPLVRVSVEPESTIFVFEPAGTVT